MEKVNKIYVANNRQGLLLVIKPTSTTQMSLSFNSGYGLRNEAYFGTDDPFLQEALEKDTRFGKTYRLERVNNMDVAEWNARQELKNSEVKTVKLPTEENQTSDKNNPKDILLDNAQAAKNFLNAEPYNIPFNQLKNKAAIFEEAKKLGLNLKLKSEQNQN